MTELQIYFIRFLLAMSILIWAVPAVFAVYRWSIAHKQKNKIVFSLSLSRKLMIVSAFLVMSVWFLRLAVSYFSKVNGIGEGLTVIEMFFDSFIHALKTLSMDEDYTHFIILGKEMVKATVSENNWCIYIYGIYASCLNLFTPLSGGAIVFDVLTTIFPKLRLKVSIFKNQCYFSELNERTLALAKSILTGNYKLWNRPLLIFTDTYLDDESEKISELFLEAKKLGAICINDDLAHLNVMCYREKQIFLMDEDEKGNIKTLSEMCENQSSSIVKKAQIYIFYQDDSYAMIEKRIYDKIKSYFEESGDRNHTPIITRVKEYENLILNLLAKKPLVESLLRDDVNQDEPYTDKNEYNLTIIGSGKIGMQMFLSSTWAGQFYGYKLNINVVSQENQKDFEDRLNKINPEILESTKEKAALLKTYGDKENKEFEEPYFTLRYGEYNFNNVDLAKVKCRTVHAFNDNSKTDVFLEQNEEAFNILESDYIFIALGSDELNIAIAEELERKISIRKKTNGNREKKIIAFVVYNTSYCNLLKDKRESLNSNVDMFPFGSVEETYHYKNVTMANKDSAALSVHEVYAKTSGTEKRKENERRLNKAIYDSLSSKAREVHFKYRVFSSFLYAKVNHSDETAWINLRHFDDVAIGVYKEEVLSEKARDDILQYLTWLEHRRWNAYMRSIGFSQFEMAGKDIKQKIHGCLFECSKKPIDGNSEIRIDDLKRRLLNVFVNEQELNAKLFADCISYWTRLPEKEQIQSEILNEAFEKVMEKLLKLRMQMDELKEECQKKINKLKKSKQSDMAKVEQIKKIKETYGAKIENIMSAVKEIINSSVDLSRKQCKKGQAFTEQIPDMLDLASKRNGEDMKFYDYPKDTDKKIIEESEK